MLIRVLWVRVTDCIFQFVSVICGDYVIAIYQPCNAMPSHAQEKEGQRSMGEYNQQGGC